MSSFLKAAKAVVWPQRCIFCNEAIFDSKKRTCESCKNALPYVKGEICSGCGRERKECTCSSSTMYYDKAAAPFYFEKGVRSCIHSLKFRSHKDYADPLGEYLYSSFISRYSGENFDFITYVPLYESDFKRRGYNQSQLLARKLSEKAGIPCKDNVLRKIYKTEKQSASTTLERSGNVLGVFEVDKSADLKDMKILLVDDIETTGSTLSECGKMLYLAGAEKVCCLCAAVTKLEKKGRD